MIRLDCASLGDTQRWRRAHQHTSHTHIHNTHRFSVEYLVFFSSFKFSWNQQIGQRVTQSNAILMKYRIIFICTRTNVDTRKYANLGHFPFYAADAAAKHLPECQSSARIRSFQRMLRLFDGRCVHIHDERVFLSPLIDHRTIQWYKFLRICYVSQQYEQYHCHCHTFHCIVFTFLSIQLE